MLKNFNPFDIFIGIVAMLCVLIAVFVVVVLFNDGILHWFILFIAASYYLGKFISEKTGL